MGIGQYGIVSKHNEIENRWRRCREGLFKAYSEIRSKKPVQKLLFHSGAEDNEPESCNKQQNGNSGWDLDGFLFIDGGFDGADLRNFFLLVISENRVHQSNYTQDQKDDAKDNGEAFHARNLSQSLIL